VAGVLAALLLAAGAGRDSGAPAWSAGVASWRRDGERQGEGAGGRKGREREKKGGVGWVPHARERRGGKKQVGAAGLGARRAQLGSGILGA
jgi:hypothetical protein